MSIVKEQIPANDMTVSDLFEEWLASKAIRSDTANGYRVKYIRYIEGILGDVRVNDITAEKWKDFETEISKRSDSRGNPLTLTGIRSLFQILHSMFTYGTKKYGLNDPMGDGILPEEKSSSETVFSPQEVEKLRNSLKPYNVNHLGIMICIYTGIQIGELCGAKWGDFDTDKSLLKVRRSLVREPTKKDKHKTELKLTDLRNKRTFRDVHIPDWINDQIILIKRMHSDDDMFIEGKNGRCEPVNFVNYVYAGFLDRAGVKFRSFTATRNTYIKVSIENGMSPEKLSRLLGEPSEEYTREKYYDKSK